MPSSKTTKSKPVRPVVGWSVVSHDLRQPLQGIATAVHELAASATEKEKLEIAQRIGLMQRTLTQMLATLERMDRLRSGALVPALQVCALGDVMSAAVAARTGAAQKRNLRLSAADSDVVVTTDVDLVAAAVDGMLLTAVRQATAGGQITLEASSRGRRATITVAFRGTDPTRALERPALVEIAPAAAQPDVPVTAIGLPLVAEVARALRGTLAVHALEPRRRIVLELPVAAERKR